VIKRIIPSFILLLLVLTVGLSASPKAQSSPEETPVVTPELILTTEVPIEPTAEATTPAPSETPVVEATTETPTVEVTEVSTETITETPTEEVTQTSIPPTEAPSQIPTTQPNSELTLVDRVIFANSPLPANVQLGANWLINNGKLTVDTSLPNEPVIYRETQAMTDDSKVRIIASWQSGIVLLHSHQTPVDGLTASFDANGTVTLLRAEVVIATGNTSFNLNQSNVLELSVDAGNIQVIVNEVVVITQPITEPVFGSDILISQTNTTGLSIDMLAIYARDEDVTAQAELLWGQDSHSCGSVTHTFSFFGSYPNYILDVKRTSGDVQYTATLTGPGVNATIPSTPDGRVIFYGPANGGGGGAGNYTLNIGYSSGTGCLVSTVWQGTRPLNDPAWGFQSSHHSMAYWRYTTSGLHYLRIERMQGSGPITYRVWNPSNAQVVNATTTHTTGIVDINNGSGEFLVEILAGNGSYRWSINSGGSAFNAPTNVTVTQKTTNSVTVSWVNQTNLHTNIQPRIGLAGVSNPPAITNLTPSSTSYTFTGLVCGTSYDMMIRASNDSHVRDSALMTVTTRRCPPTNDNFNNAITIPAQTLNGSWTTSTFVESATVEANEIGSCVGDNQNTVWYKYTPTTNQQFSVNTIGSSYDTVINVYRTISGVLYTVDCNDDINPTNNASVVGIQATAGVTYHIKVTQFGTTPLPDNSQLVLNLLVPTPPIAPTLVTPLNGGATNDTTPTFSWTSVAGMTYDVQVSLSSTFANELIYTSATNSMEWAQTLMNGTYFWRVRSVSADKIVSPWSVSRTLIIDTVPLPTLSTLSAPVANAILTTAKPVFSWGIVSGAARYRIEFAPNSTFDVGTVTTADVAAVSYTALTNLGQGNWWWRVATIDVAGNVGAFTSARQFTVNHQLNPLNNLAFTATTLFSPTFQFAAVTGVTGYNVVVATDTDFSQIVLTSPTLISTLWTVPTAQALPFGIYYWRVDVAGIPAVSNVYRTFKIVPPLPVAPVQTLPANASLVNTWNPTFQWNPVTYAYGSLTYDLQVSTVATVASSYVINETGLLDTNFVGTLTADAIYYWRVRTVNSYGSASAWSTIRSFTVDTIAPTAPTITAPINMSVTTSTRPTLTSSVPVGANRFAFDIAQDIDFNTPVLTDVESATASLALTATILSTPLDQGVYYVRAQARDAAGNWSVDGAPSMFAIDLMTAPLDRQNYIGTTARPTISWVAFGVPSTIYSLDIATDETFNNLVFTTTTTSLTYTLSVAEALPLGQYFVRLGVNGIPNFNVYRRFSVTNALPAVPILSAPAVSALMNINTTNLTVLPVVNAVGYEFQLSQLATFANAPILSTGDVTFATQALNDGLWYWRARAVNQYGAVSGWAVARSFTVDTTAPSVPNLLIPANGAILTTLRPAITWSAVVGANLYEVRIGDAAFTNPLVVAVATTTYTPTADLANRVYSWSVRARDAAGNWSDWSAARTFTPASIAGSVISTCRSMTPTLNLAWEPVSWAIAYEVQVSRTNTFELVNIVFSSNTIPNNQTTVTTSTLPNVRYYWRVRAQASNSTWGLWSIVSACTVDATNQ
jgi:hypothetical protein